MDTQTSYGIREKEPKMIVISFYTEQYEEFAQRLIGDLDMFGIEHDIVKLDLNEYLKEKPDTVNVKHWLTRYGVKFIRKMYDKYPDQDLLYMHADGKIRKPLEIDLPDKTDIGVSKGYGIPVWLKPKKLSMDVLGAPILFKHNKRVEKFLDAYNERVETDIRNNGEQVIFSDICNEFKEKLNLSYFGEGFAVNVLRIPIEAEVEGKKLRFRLQLRQSVDYYDPQVVV